MLRKLLDIFGYYNTDDRFLAQNFASGDNDRFRNDLSIVSGKIKGYRGKSDIYYLKINVDMLKI